MGSICEIPCTIDLIIPKMFQKRGLFIIIIDSEYWLFKLINILCLILSLIYFLLLWLKCDSFFIKFCILNKFLYLLILLFNKSVVLYIYRPICILVLKCVYYWPLEIFLVS